MNILTGPGIRRPAAVLFRLAGRTYARTAETKNGDRRLMSKRPAGRFAQDAAVAFVRIEKPLFETSSNNGLREAEAPAEPPDDRLCFRSSAKPRLPNDQRRRHIER